MTREQDNVIERLALQHGRVHVGRPDVTLAGQPAGTRELTIPSGRTFVVSPTGREGKVVDSQDFG